MGDNRGSLLLVVDADILRAAGHSEGHASNIREVLQTILTVCHRVLLSGEARSEWDTHASRFARTWWTAMSSRGKIQPVVLQLASHEAALGSCGLAPERLPNLNKDLHLVVAALEHGDRIVISNDKRAAGGFSELACAIPAYGGVAWWDSEHPIPPRLPN